MVAEAAAVVPAVPAHVPVTAVPVPVLEADADLFTYFYTLIKSSIYSDSDFWIFEIGNIP